MAKEKSGLDKLKKILTELNSKGRRKAALEHLEFSMEPLRIEPGSDLHIQVLIETGMIDHAIQVMAQYGITAGKELIPRMADLLPILKLDAVNLPEELQTDYSAVREALEAYCQGDIPACETGYKSISIRSPFLNWRLLLKALVEFDRKDDAASIATFRKISSDSALCKVAEAYIPIIQLYSQSGDPSGLLTADKDFLLHVAGPASNDFLSILDFFRKLDDNRLLAAAETIETLRFHEPECSNLKNSLRLLIFQKTMDDPDCFRSRTIHRLKSIFKDPEITQNLTIGMISQLPFGMPASVAQEQIKEWTGEWDIKRNSGKKMKLAAAYRFVLHKGIEQLNSVWISGQFHRETEALFEVFREIQRLDPGFKPDYALVVGFALKNDLNRSFPLLLECIETFNDDVHFLLLAAEYQTIHDKLKEAGDYLERAEKLDPLNMEIRSKKVKLLLASAHKSYKRRSYESACKDIRQAKLLTTSPSEKTDCLICELAVADAASDRSSVNRIRKDLENCLPLSKIHLAMRLDREVHFGSAQLESEEFKRLSKANSPKLRDPQTILKFLSDWDEFESSSHYFVQAIGGSIEIEDLEFFDDDSFSNLLDILAMAENYSLIAGLSLPAIRKFHDLETYIFDLIDAFKEKKSPVPDEIVQSVVQRHHEMVEKEAFDEEEELDKAIRIIKAHNKRLAKKVDSKSQHPKKHGLKQLELFK
jgi:hypothetical protein